MEERKFLRRERNLDQAVNLLRERKRVNPSQNVDDVMDFIADLYDLTANQLRHIVQIKNMTEGK